ncbi:hypothetical protein D9758_013464 [Tetrapyrgos nigripes]|uniref:C2H2-type domain-containing protein n=1 Tax=Tetrapyrgos nigripes TaxID=182062 RepID=A0A8H5CT46_9AGAR|nr:hypothetical protein D9758_013464 [Tetrapyrgos nigripes]
MVVSCSYPGCRRTFKRFRDLTKHTNAKHIGSIQLHTAPSAPSTETPLSGLFDQTAGSEPESFHSPSSPPPPTSPPPPEPTRPRESKNYHPFLTGDICDENGDPIDPSTPPPPLPDVENVWAPFEDEVQLRLADFCFRKAQMSQSDIDELLDIWFLSLSKYGAESGPFDNHNDLLEAIDNIRVGGAPWKCFETAVDSNLPSDAPEWQKASYQVWYRDPDVVIANILSNPDFAKEFDVAPYIHLDKNGKRRWSDFMTGNYSWRHATQIYEDNPTMQGAMYCPVILGADKTTVSVGTGHVEYHPLYLSIGNLRNSARRGHRNGVIPIGFLAIPKSDRHYDNDPKFRLFKKQLYHSSLSAILSSLRPGMTVPIIRRCPDGHFRRVVYDLGAFIADYPEQVYLSGVVQGWCSRCRAPASNLDESAPRRSRHLDTVLLKQYEDDGTVLWDNFGMDQGVIPFTTDFPRADIHEMMSPDLLHQVIKGCFKDMLVDWCFEYLVLEHGEEAASKIMDDIDYRIAAVPPFPGLRRFPHGRRFKQWTGDDSKALMKVFMAAVAEYLPPEMMKCLSSLLDFCYLVRRSDIDEPALQQIQACISRFHYFRQIFITTNVREDFSLPRLHSMVHYPLLIMEFGAPNGLCSTITESRHITAVKKPWRRSNHWQAISQMLLINQRVDKLLALRADLVERELLLPLHQPLPDPFDMESDDVGAADGDCVPSDVVLAKTRAGGYPRYVDELADYIGQPLLPALVQQFLDEQVGGTDIPVTSLRISVFHSAVATFYAPSDISGIRGMMRERIRSTGSWRGHTRRDTVLVVTNSDRPGFRGMSVARVLLFFSFKSRGTVYPCALIHWFNAFGQRPDPNTGMWIVRPAYRNRRYENPSLAVIHLDTILRGVHLLPVYGVNPIPPNLHYSLSLDVFNAFYVNKYADHHANEIIF